MKEQMLSIVKRNEFPSLPDDLPGPQALATGNPNVGFFGEITGTEFITYAALTTLAGITTGTAMTDASFPDRWLKVAYNGNVQYISRWTIRNGVSWAVLNTLGLITGKVVTIKGKRYKIRLMQGANVDPWSGVDNAAGGTETVGTEWNKLIYGLCNAAPLEGPLLANYTTDQLGLSPFSRNGTSILVKELSTTGTSTVRGNASGAIRGLYKYPGTTATTDAIRGWKPVVEFVPD